MPRNKRTSLPTVGEIFSRTVEECIEIMQTTLDKGITVAASQDGFCYRLEGATDIDGKTTYYRMVWFTDPRDGGKPDFIQMSLKRPPRFYITQG